MWGRYRPPARQRASRGGPDVRAAGALLGLVVWLIGILFVLPILWMVLTSFHSEADAATNPPSLAAPLTLDGYREFVGASTGASPWPPLLNSMTASILSTALVLLLAIRAAYAPSIRLVRKWTDVLFFLSTRMLPVVAGLLPIYLFAQQVGLLDDIWLLIVFYTSMNLPIAVWMMRSFLAEVPVEMLEAASMDGAGLPRTLREIVAPVVMPGIAATALICFIFSWNELLFARVLTATVAQTAPVFLTSSSPARACSSSRCARPRWSCRSRCSSPASPPRTSSSRACPSAPSSSRAGPGPRCHSADKKGYPCRR